MKEMYGKQVYDSLEEIINPKHTALLVVDMQNDFCSPGGHFAESGQDIAMLEEIALNVAKLIEAARKAGVRVVFIQNTMLPQGGSDSPAWLHFKSKVSGIAPEYTVEGTWGQQFCAGLEPREDEPIVKKHRSSAFVATDLDLVLRSNGIESIIVSGCVTHGCVLATARHGAFLDYYVVVAKDCIASTSRELHEAAMKIMENRLDVVSLQEILTEWS